MSRAYMLSSLAPEKRTPLLMEVQKRLCLQ